MHWSVHFKGMIFWSGRHIAMGHGSLWGSGLRLQLTTRTKHHPSWLTIMMINNFPSDFQIDYIMLATQRGNYFIETSIIQVPLHCSTQSFCTGVTNPKLNPVCLMKVSLPHRFTVDFCPTNLEIWRYKLNNLDLKQNVMKWGAIRQLLSNILLMA